MDNKTVTELRPWEVIVFDWGTAVRHRNGRWTRVILNGGQEIDVSEIDVILHDNGIEFV